MTVHEQFDKWFNETFPLYLYPEGEEREELETYTWLAWRDSRRVQEPPQ